MLLCAESPWELCLKIVGLQLLTYESLHSNMYLWTIEGKFCTLCWMAHMDTIRFLDGLTHQNFFSKRNCDKAETKSRVKRRRCNSDVKIISLQSIEEINRLVEEAQKPPQGAADWDNDEFLDGALQGDFQNEPVDEWGELILWWPSVPYLPWRLVCYLFKAKSKLSRVLNLHWQALQKDVRCTS